MFRQHMKPAYKFLVNKIYKNRPFNMYYITDGINTVLIKEEINKQHEEIRFVYKPPIELTK